jgi:hypothetical protein
MVRETTLHVEDLIYPLFVMEGTAQREAVASMPGCYRYRLDLLLVEIKEAEALGIGAIALFPLIPNAQKDNAGTESYNPEGLVPRAVRSIKQAFPDVLVITMECTVYLSCQRFKKSMINISAAALEQQIDAGEEVIDRHFDPTTTRIGTPRPMTSRRSQDSATTHIDLPAPLLSELDNMATELDISRQAVINMMLRRALDEHYLAKKTAS